MTCQSQCWTANGSDKIYDLTNEFFRVYLNNYAAELKRGHSVLREHFAKDNKFELHYEVKGICNEISAGSP